MIWWRFISLILYFTRYDFLYFYFHERVCTRVEAISSFNWIFNEAWKFITNVAVWDSMR